MWKRLILCMCIVIFALSPPHGSGAGEVGVTDEEVLVGTSMDLSGPVAHWGINISAAIEAYFQYVNDNGGVHGRKLKLIVYDHSYQPPKAVTNIRRLVERDKVFVILGHMGTPTTRAIMDYTDKKGVPNLFPSSMASLWGKAGRYIFGDVSSYTEQARIIVDYLVKERGFTRMAAFYQDDDYGLDALEAGRERLAQHGLSYAAEIPYKRGDVDFSSQAARLKEANPEAVILQSVYKEPPRLAQQSAAIGFKPLWIGMAPMVLDKVAELGGKDVEGMMGVKIWAGPFDPEPAMALYREIISKYKPNMELEFAGVHGFIKGILFVEGLKRAGRDLTREKLIDALEGIEDFDPGLGMKFTFGPDDHQGADAGYLVQIRDGKWVRVSDWLVVGESVEP